MSLDLQLIYAGSTTDVWEISLATSPEGVVPAVLALLDDNYSCRLAVLSANPAIAREITVKDETGTKFLAWLTPAETFALGKGTWKVGLELRNLTMVPPLAHEIHELVRIEPGLFPAP